MLHIFKCESMGQKRGGFMVISLRAKKFGTYLSFNKGERVVFTNDSH